jgi:uncharacterized protein YcbX
VTDTSVCVQSISLYPIKSLDPVVVPVARVLASGALEHDREFALLDEHGKFINGKRDARIHRIRSTFDIERALVAVSRDDSEPETFHLVENRAAIERWFADFFGFPVFLQRNERVGFPDDLESPGPTIVGAATLREVGAWFNLQDSRQTGRRFRANIELSSDVPFWEDCLFGDPASTVQFQIGAVRVFGVNPCQRCAVPARDPVTGAVTTDFQRVFAEQREKTLPPWAAKAHFNHHYRLTVNTRIPASEEGKTIRVGDALGTYPESISGIRESQS